MDIIKFNFPQVTELDMVFPTFETDKELLKEAKERGFYDGKTPYNKLFRKIFYEGGTVRFKADLDKEFVNKAWPYVKSFMGSWAPKHQEKEAICALLFSEMLLPDIEK